MDVVTLMVAAVTPAIVTAVTGYIKKLGTLPIADNRVLWIRAIVAVLALIGAGLTQVVGGEALDGGLVEAAILALFNAAAATWLYTRSV